MAWGWPFSGVGRVMRCGFQLIIEVEDFDFQKAETDPQGTASPVSGTDRLNASHGELW